jgi:hypothetical protein
MAHYGFTVTVWRARQLKQQDNVRRKQNYTAASGALLECPAANQGRAAGRYYHPIS